MTLAEGVQLESLPQAAKRLGISLNTMYRLRDQGKIQVHKIGTASRVVTDQVNRAILGEVAADQLRHETNHEEEASRRTVGRPRGYRGPIHRLRQLLAEAGELVEELEE